VVNSIEGFAVVDKNTSYIRWWL